MLKRIIAAICGKPDLLRHSKQRALRELLAIPAELQASAKTIEEVNV